MNFLYFPNSTRVILHNDSLILNLSKTSKIGIFSHISSIAFDFVRELSYRLCTFLFSFRFWCDLDVHLELLTYLEVTSYKCGQNIFHPNPEGVFLSVYLFHNPNHLRIYQFDNTYKFFHSCGTSATTPLLVEWPCKAIS